MFCTVLMSMHGGGNVGSERGDSMIQYLYAAKSRGEGGGRKVSVHVSTSPPHVSYS